MREQKIFAPVYVSLHEPATLAHFFEIYTSQDLFTNLFISSHLETRLIFKGHFAQKSPIISGSFAGNDLQLKVSYQSAHFSSRNLRKNSQDLSYGEIFALVHISSRTRCTRETYTLIDPTEQSHPHLHSIHRVQVRDRCASIYLFMLLLYQCKCMYTGTSRDIYL